MISKGIILSLDVTSQHVSDSQVLPILTEDITIKQNKKLNIIIADGHYDNNNNLQYLSFNGTKPVIKIRRNARIRNGNHYLIKKIVKLQKKIYNNGGRTASAIARDNCRNYLLLYQENVWTICYCYYIRFENIIREVMLKVSLYNWFQSIAIT